jgi:class 3 adenylate cyclase/TolB-like protein
MGREHYQYDSQAFGIGRAFLFAGVRNYIGTFWVVHDEESRDFALMFYQRLATGLSLGEALLQARLALRSQSGGERLTWASYMLYGDPAVTLFPAVVEPSTPSPLVGIERKLVVILSADVKGYSRLMGEDDLATVQTLIAHRAVMTTLIQQYRGEVIDTPGDNLLALFPSVIGAVQCAVEIQQELKLRNAALPAHRQMEFRIGINLGDVIVRARDVHGEGINIAARLEGLAEPGGICISGVVYEQVKNKLALRCEALGEKILKNIKNPVPVFRVVLKFGLPPLQEKKEGKTTAIIVRPFKVLKADPQHAWIKDNDAIPHRLTSALSHVPELQVYPPEHFDGLLQRCHLSDLELARELGITKVIRGSFLAAGNTCHIEAHLDDVEHTVHEPSDEVQGELGDFFQLIQDLAMKIASRLNLTAETQPGLPTAPSPPSLDMLTLMSEEQEFMAWYPFNAERPQ